MKIWKTVIPLSRFDSVNTGLHFKIRDFHAGIPLNLKRMRNLIFTVFFMTTAFCARAQKVYFMYLQTDDFQPFYVKMNNRIYSSATQGYLILPSLVDSTYQFSVGFPSSAKESRFVVPVNGKDRGFLLKRFETGWGLFDLQSLSVIRAEKLEADETISYQKRNDDFSSLLSRAANDTSLLYAVVVKRDLHPEKKSSGESKAEAVPEETETNLGEAVLQKDTVVRVPVQAGVAQQNANKDTASDVVLTEKPKRFADPDSPAGEQASPPVDTASGATTASDHSPYQRSTIRKHAESSTSEGFGLVFYDIQGQVVDTIRLIIPNPKIVLAQQDAGSSSKENEFIQLSELQKDSVVAVGAIESPAKAVPMKSHCKAIATERDFFRLRKDMAAEETDEAMVDEAKKYFKSKCFSTEQIKNLSALFLTSAGKYLFFDAAYLHVSDQEKFPALRSEIKDDYFLKRFKALVGE